MEGRTDLSDIIFLLTICGGVHVYEGTKRRLFAIYHNVTLSIVIAGNILCLISISMSDLKESFTRSFFFAISGILTTTYAINFYVHRKELSEAVLLIKDIVQKRIELKHKEHFRKISKISWSLMRILNGGFLMMLISYNITPQIYDLYLVIFTDSNEPFSLPMANKGIFGTEHPPRSFLYYCVTWLLILCNTFGIMASLGIFATLVVIVLYISNEFKIISEEITEWGNSYSKQAVEKSIASLKLIIRKHQIVLRVTTMVQRSIGLPFLAFYIFYPILQTFLLNSALINQEKEMLSSINNIVIVILSVLTWLLCAIIGETLENEGFKIYTSACNTPWYQMLPKLRKDLNMIINQSQRPVTIHYRGYGHLNLPGFMNMMNTGYSYLMFFISMRSTD